MYLKLLIIAFFYPTILYSQGKSLFELEIKVSQEDSIIYSKNLVNKYYKDSVSSINAINSLVNIFRQSGYLLAGLDSIKLQNNKMTSYLYIGKKYNWLILEKGDLPQEIRNKLNIREEYFSEKGLSLSNFFKMRKEMIDYGQNNGYPFASLELDSISIYKQNINAKINYRLGDFVRFDTIITSQNIKLKNTFLIKYLAISKGKPYSKNLILTIEKKIQQLSYLKLKKAPWVKFNQSLAYLNLSLEPEKADRVNFFLGLLPNTDNKLQLAGELFIELKNSFGKGRRIYVEGKKLKSQSQSLAFEYDHPFIFNSKFDLSLSFSLLKQDSSFLNFDRKLSVFYQNFIKGKIAFFSNYKSTRVLSNVIENNIDVLPNIASSSYLSFGLYYFYQNTDDFINPKNGVKIVSSIEIGSKKIEKENSVDDNLYTNIALNSTQLILVFDFYKYLALGKKQTLLLKNSSGSIFNKYMFLNDLFRLGGVNLLRGFNENVFFASNYFVNTAELRYFFETRSFLFLFADFALVRSSFINNQFKDYPIGIGGGISLKTKTGLFTLTYSVGNSLDQPLSTKFSKVYFNLVNRF